MIFAFKRKKQTYASAAPEWTSKSLVKLWRTDRALLKTAAWRAFIRFKWILILFFVGGVIALNKDTLIEKGFGIFAISFFVFGWLAMTKKEIYLMRCEEKGGVTIPEITHIEFIGYIYPFFGRRYLIDYIFYAEGVRYQDSKIFFTNFFDKNDFSSEKFVIHYRNESPDQHVILRGDMMGSNIK